MANTTSNSPKSTGRKSGATDLSSLLSAVNEASARVGVLWLSFLTFMAYLTMTVGAVTHEDLLKQKAIRLPVLNVELPMVGFFWIAPLFFILFHFYLFLQILILVRKTAVFEEKLNTTVADEYHEQYRSLLDSFVVVQLRVGPEEERSRVTARLLRGIAFITLVLLPILLLLQFQLTFLPYHDASVTWMHRIALIVDLRLCWVFWPALASANHRAEIFFPEITFFRFDRIKKWNLRQSIKNAARSIRCVLQERPVGFSLSIMLAFISLFIFAYKDEPISKVVQIPYFEVWNNEVRWGMKPAADALLQSSINMVEGRPRTWFSNVLVVPEKKLIDDNSLHSDFPALSLRGRNLSGAILVGSDLRHTDFTGANLNDARFDRALLSRAKFKCAVSYDAHRKSQRWPDDECTWLQRATFLDAKLQAADFDRARMHGAILIGANLKGARFTGTQLQGVMFNNAQMQAATIIGSRLNKAYLNGANLVGAKVSKSDLRGVLIGDTHFQLTYLEHDREKIRWVRNLALTPALAEQRGLREAAITAENDKIADQFKFTEILEARLLADLEYVEPGFDIEVRVAKLRYESIAMMAAESKMPFFDPEKAYNFAPETELGAVKMEIENAKRSRAPSGLIAESAMKDYLLDFVCDIGSSPYIAAALVRDEAILWALEKLLDEDGSGINQAMEVISRLRGSPDCPGSMNLNQADLAAVDYLRLKIAHMAKEKRDQVGSRESGSKVRESRGPERQGPTDINQ